MRKDHSVILTGRGIAGNEVIAERKAIAHHLVKTRCHDACGHVYRTFWCAEAQDSFRRRLQLLKDRSFLFPLDEVLAHDPFLITQHLWPQGNEPVCIRVLRQEINVALNEDCGVDAEAKGQRDQHNENWPRDPSQNCRHPDEAAVLVRELTHRVRRRPYRSRVTIRARRSEDIAMST